jgi:hypothetical protein
MIFVSSTGFTSPQSPPPLNLKTASSITEDSGHTVVHFTSYADSSNTLFGMTGGTVVSNGVSYSATGQQGTGATANPTLFSPNGATYSLTNTGQYTMDAGTSLTVVSGNTTVTATPAPPGVVLALSALPVLALGQWMRRRRK